MKNVDLWQRLDALTRGARRRLALGEGPCGHRGERARRCPRPRGHGAVQEEEEEAAAHRRITHLANQVASVGRNNPDLIQGYSAVCGLVKTAGYASLTRPPYSEPEDDGGGGHLPALTCLVLARKSPSAPGHNLRAYPHRRPLNYIGDRPFLPRGGALVPAPVVAGGIGARAGGIPCRSNRDMGPAAVPGCRPGNPPALRPAVRVTHLKGVGPVPTGNLRATGLGRKGW